MTERKSKNESTKTKLLDEGDRSREIITRNLEILGFKPEEKTLRGMIKELVKRYFENKDCQSKFPPEKFYPMFCASWQAVLSPYTGKNTDENSWSNTVQDVLESLTVKNEISNSEKYDKLRAMCASYVIHSIPHMLSVEAKALRFLVHISSQFNLGYSKEYLSWLFDKLHSMVTEVLRFEPERSVFLKLLLEFFLKVEEYDYDLILVISKVFQDENFMRHLQGKDESVTKLKDMIVKIFDKIMESSYKSENIFIFETIYDCFSFKVKDRKAERVKFPNDFALSKDQMKRYELLLMMYKSNEIKDLDTFYKSNPGVISENVYKDLRQTMKLLIFTGLAYNKNEMKISDVVKELELEDDFKDVGRLVFQLKSRDIADLMLDINRGCIVINHCQPRIFDEKVADDVLKKVKFLSSKIV